MQKRNLTLALSVGAIIVAGSTLSACNHTPVKADSGATTSAKPADGKCGAKKDGSCGAKKDGSCGAKKDGSCGAKKDGSCGAKK